MSVVRVFGCLVVAYQNFLGGFLSRCGIVVGKICRVYLVRPGKELHWLSKILNLDCGNIMHLLEFMDVSLEFRSVGRACGRVFKRLDII